MQSDDTQRAARLRKSPTEMDDTKKIKTEYDELKKVIAALADSVNNGLTKSVEIIKEQTGHIPDIRKALQESQADIEELKRTIQENNDRLDGKIDSVASKCEERWNGGEVRLDDKENCIKNVEEFIRTPDRTKGTKLGKVLSTGSENQRDLLLRFQLAADNKKIIIYRVPIGREPTMRKVIPDTANIFQEIREELAMTQARILNTNTDGKSKN